MAEDLEYEIEIVRTANKFRAIINSKSIPIREREAQSLEELLDRVAREIQEENEEG